MEAKFKAERVAPLKTSMDQDRRQKLFLIRNKWEKLYGEVQLAVFEVQHDPKVGKGLWEWISTWVMARGIFESGQGSFQKPKGLLKEFFKRHFSK